MNLMLVPIVMMLSAIGWLGMQLHSLPLMIIGVIPYIFVFYYLIKASQI